MLGRDRFLAIATAALFGLPLAAAILATPAAATAGRDSAAAAYDGTLGPFLGAFDGSVFVQAAPAPAVDDWYKYPVYSGQIFQATLVIPAGGTLTVYHQDGTTQLAVYQTFNDGAHCGFGMANIDLIITQTERLYLKVSAPPASMNQQYYNLAMRAYNATVLNPGDSVTPAPNNASIHGWAIPTIAGSCASGGVIVPELYVSDYYWVNATDAAGPNHQNYRLSLSYTCSTAIIDMYLSQLYDPLNQNYELLNHTLAWERRENRLAASGGPYTMDFAPALYDGHYLLEVNAVENGSFSNSGPSPRYTYSLSLGTLGGNPKDGNDRLDGAPWVNSSQTVNGRIDARDDSGDWYRFALNQGDTASVGITLNRENNQIVDWGQRYRATVFDPNGSAIVNATNWAGNVFNPYMTIPSFNAPMDGNYSLLLMTADGGLNSLVQATRSGYVGHTWADYVLNFQLPNRKPVQLAPLPDLIMDEDTSGSIDLAPYFKDPEMKFGYPTFAIGTSPNFTFGLSTAGGGAVLTATPHADWNGNDRVGITVRDDVPANSWTTYLNITVLPVNDAPRIFAWASANWSSVSLLEDSQTNVPLRSIFYDIDNIDLNYSAGGVSGGHLTVDISNNSQIATITPQANWNGCQQITWTAIDAGNRTASFPTMVCVIAQNDPPRATDTRMDRIVFNEGGEYTVDLTNEFYDIDQEDQGKLRYYGFIDDPNVAKYVRINNSLLDPTDPHMRIYVVDAYRADYFTDGPVQVRFQVWDPQNNTDPSQGGIEVVVEKTTFLEILNVNDPPVVDDFTPRPEEVANAPYHEGDTITFSVTSIRDADGETQFTYHWFVNGDWLQQELSPTFIFKTALDRTHAGQYDAGNYTVSVQVFDGSGAKAELEPTWNFTVLKTNRKPSLTLLKPTATSFEEGTRIDFSAIASDEDPEDAGLVQISWSYTTPQGQVVPLGSGKDFSKMLDPGTYLVTVGATDGIDTTTQTFSITVAEHKLNTPGFDLGAAVAGLALAGAFGLAHRGRRKRAA